MFSKMLFFSMHAWLDSTNNMPCVRFFPIISRGTDLVLEDGHVGALVAADARLQVVHDHVVLHLSLQIVP